MRAFRWLGIFLLLIYLLALIYFGGRPFQTVPGWGASSATATEIPGAGPLLWKALTATGQMTLDVELRTDDLGQGGPARIVTFSRGAMSRNFTLGQSGNGLVFRLRTTETDCDGQHRSLLIPQVFMDTDWHRVVVSFDSHQVRLVVDGRLHPSTLALGGDFSNWGHNHVLVLGDEVTGGRVWHGDIRQLFIYDRAWVDGDVGDPILGLESLVAEPLRCRNLFVTVDPAAYDRDDFVLNVIGFIPLAGLLFWIFPSRQPARLLLVLPVGLVLSGAIEWGQRGIVGRVPCFPDLLSNLLGTVLGGLLVWGLLKVHSTLG